jgi:hypothetical protein
MGVLIAGMKVRRQCQHPQAQGARQHEAEAAL